MPYTFGDNESASHRLRRLAELYEPETRALLVLFSASAEARTPSLAVDLGCGPGWTTQLLASLLKPERTVGLDSSDRFIAEAKENHPQLEFLRHDILQSPFPIEAPDLFFCRFLLTHLSAPLKVLKTWAEIAAPQATLIIHETETIESDHPALHRYYELVAEMQRHNGQTLHVGAVLRAGLDETGWRVRHNRTLTKEKPAMEMAQLHLPNLRTWGRNEFAVQAFDRRELDQLETALDSIASGASEAGLVHNTARQIVAERR